MILFVREETCWYLEAIGRSKMQMKFPVIFKYPNRQDRETQLRQQEDEPSRPRRWPIEHSAWLVAAFGGQAEDSLRVPTGESQGCPH